MSNPKEHSTCLQHTVIWKNTEVACSRHQARRSICFNQLSFLSEEVWCRAERPEGQQHGILAPVLCLEGCFVSAKSRWTKILFLIQHSITLNKIYTTPSPCGNGTIYPFPCARVPGAASPTRYFQVKGAGKSRTWLFKYILGLFHTMLEPGSMYVNFFQHSMSSSV